MTTTQQKTDEQTQNSRIIIGAILCYTNPLHHPTPGIQAWAMTNNRPINYRSEIEPTEDQRIRDDKGGEKQRSEDTKEVDNPDKTDENIPVPDTEEGEPEDLPDTEDPNVAKDDVSDI
ncbi:hypothetical protein [Sphingobacterium corticibacter]|uniref:Uncharacterized protein n=1 Tax=Sphingobacterium corticibacter TaxID=2171749 RepID=A0A2T8HMQ1_9SPHI|nr:hypothetical protein [Sphingobacterium corticibacter]PVH26721.1 hypothetical protein DC487_03685 [Sphingobacterium corticibacter]